MGNILTDSNGNPLVANNTVFEVTSAIDSNIQAGNIKKDVTILGVTGTYEGSGGGATPVVTVSGTTVTQTLSPNTHYVFECVESLTITLDTPTTDIVNEYTFEFDSGINATVLSLPNNIIFNNTTTTITPNRHYEYNIKYNLTTETYFGIFSEWAYVTLPDNSILVDRSISGYLSTSGNILKVSKNYNTSNGIKVYYSTSGNLYLIGTAYVNGNNLKMQTDQSGNDYLETVIYTAVTPTTYLCTWITGEPCFVSDTNITLANGSKKKIQDIEYTDDLLVWDFDNGKLTSAKPLWITKQLTTTHYHKVYLSDGTTLNFVGSVGYHRLYDVDNGCFTLSVKMTGRKTIKEDGSIVEVLKWEDVIEDVEYYNVITNYHMNCYAEGVLTSCRYSNVYPISKDMKYIKDNRQIIPYEIFKEKIEEKYYNGLRIGEQQFTINEIVKYCTNMINTEKK